MHHRVLRLTAVLLATALFASCGANPFPPVTVDFGQLTADAPRMISIPLDEKVGQLFVVPARGVYMSEESKDYLTLRHQVVDNHVGGVILFRSNVYEAAVLVQKLQGIARVPLLVSADLEAGLGMRFDEVTYGAWAMAVAATGDPALAERRAAATGREARAIGIGQVFAPVADVNVNPDNPVINVRSFGEDPEDVARYVVAVVRGLQLGQVLATLKHFPGHGDTATDSHRSLASVPADRARLESVELVPFRAGIKAGAESVMIAHVSVPALDDAPAPVLASPVKSPDAIGETLEVVTGAVPATVSVPVVTGLLRKELGFKGLVVTDSMRMGAITSHYEAGEAAIRAILAGADQILISNDTDAAIAAVLAAVKSGRIPEKRIDESVKRILDLKQRLNLYDKGIPFVGKIATIVDTPAIQALEAEIARRSLTLVREEKGALPLQKGTKLLSLVIADEASLNGPTGPLAADLKARVPSVKTVRLDPRSTPEETRAAVEAAKNSDAVLVSLFVRTRSGQGKISVPESGKSALGQILALGKPVVTVSFGSPYLLRDFPDLPTYLCAWGGQDASQTATVQALFGETAIGGKLPITIPGLAKRGDGISRAVQK
ncbi:MAG: glycoside hydrolase family 3 N-terminal domain-containing protein [Acidobacteriota bacterium]|nr:glycoside hydrolase family 3 N-terminal domain-containing protein [Acidobacteriota bacterium]